MPQIDDLPPLRVVIRRHGLSAKKSLGQNFLLDLNLTARIARAGGPLEGATVVEVGPGPGGLTRALLTEGARRVIAIQRARRTGGDRGALSGPAGDRGRRCVGIRRARAAFRRTRARGRQPALQYRDRAANRLADRAVAALVRRPGADVPARGGDAHRRQAGKQDLWPAVGAGELALRAQDYVRRSE